LKVSAQKCPKPGCNPTRLFPKKFKLIRLLFLLILVSSEDKDPKAYDESKTEIFNRLRLSASAAKDPDGYIKSYVWDFGDGHKNKGLLQPISGKNPENIL